MNDIRTVNKLGKAMRVFFHVTFVLFLIVALFAEIESELFKLTTWFIVYTTGIPVVFGNLILIGYKMGWIKDK